MADPSPAECRKQLLNTIREVGGEWTGAKVARWWNLRYQSEITRWRGDRHLFIPMAYGHLVQTRPPRGRTFMPAQPPTPPGDLT